MVNDLMSSVRFEFITKNIIYHTKPFPTYNDPFHVIRELQDAWNENLKAVFNAGWMVCLDESMMKWLNKFTCPGFVFCPQKPWPYGNEWHTIACVESSIIFFVELVEGKHCPKELGEKSM